MAEQQIMHGVRAKRCTAKVGKQNLPVAPRRLAKPCLQDGHGGFGKRYTSFLSALSDYTHMNSRPESEIIASQAAHFRLTESGLRSDQEKRVIAPSEPGALIRRGEQRLDLRSGEEVHLGPGK